MVHQTRSYYYITITVIVNYSVNRHSLYTAFRLNVTYGNFRLLCVDHDFFFPFVRLQDEAWRISMCAHACCVPFLFLEHEALGIASRLFAPNIHLSVIPIMLLCERA